MVVMCTVCRNRNNKSQNQQMTDRAGFSVGKSDQERDHSASETMSGKLRRADVAKCEAQISESGLHSIITMSNWLPNKGRPG